MWLLLAIERGLDLVAQEALLVPMPEAHDRSSKGDVWRKPKSVHIGKFM